MALKDIFKKKAVPIVNYISETSRDGINKSFIPKFLYKPSFGYPRFEDMSKIRFLAKTPYVEMAIDTILKEISSLDWSVVPNPVLRDEIFVKADGSYKDNVRSEITHQENFLDNPNTNFEDFKDVFIKQALRDVLEVNTGLLNKVFNLKGDMVEIVARDGVTFTKNPDIHGMFTDREDLILQKDVVQRVNNPLMQMNATSARNKAAYFQYGWISGPVPTPFGKREVVWMENMKRTDDIYGYSPVQILKEALQMLIYHIETDLEYFTDNNVPKGIIGLDSSDTTDLKQFKQQWFDQQYTRDKLGNLKKSHSRVPIMNFIPKFERIQFSSQELELIEKQKWYSKMVWACFGVTPTELGYTEDAKGQSNQIEQSKVFKKKAVNPNIRLLEKHINREIIPEFKYFETYAGVQIPKYIFKFHTFDIDEEDKKADLYNKQIWKTVNEVRKAEGLESLEGGDVPISKWKKQSSFEESQVNNGGAGQKSTVEGKPFAGYNDFQSCVNDNQDKQNPQAYCAEIHKQATGNYPNEKKALNTSSPLAPKEHELVYSTSEFARKIKKELEDSKKRLLEVIESQANGSSQLQNIKSEEFEVEVKSLNDVIKKIGGFVSIDGIKNYLSEFMKKQFNKGAVQGEEKVNNAGHAYNYVPDYDAINYMSDYTFDNIKDIEKEVENDLRQELQRGYMNGEGVTSLKNRVKNVFDTHDQRAETIARTESNRASNFGKLNAFKQSGVSSKKWLLWTDDSRTSKITRELHKKYGSPEKAIDMNDNFKLKVTVGNKVWNIDQPAPPFHPNERDEMMIEPVFEN